MSETGKAAVFVGANKPFEIKEYPIPEPADNDLVVRVTRTNICGSDIHLWRGDGDLKNLGAIYNMILGHEMVGQIAKQGKGATRDSLGQPIKEGDRVVFTYYVHCGNCKACYQGNTHMCMMAISSVLRPADMPPHFIGGFAEYYYVKSIQHVFKLPDIVSDVSAAGANCALSQIIHSLHVVNFSFQETLVIQGAGGLGLFACAVAKESGASKIIIIDAISERLEMAKRFGADHCINIMDYPDPKQRINEVLKQTNQWGADVVIEVAGVPAAVTEGIQMLCRGGRYLEVGCVSPGHDHPFDPSMLSTQNKTIYGVSLYPPSSLKKAIDFLAQNESKYPFKELQSHEYRLEDINQAFEESDPHNKNKQSSVTRASIVSL